MKVDVGPIREETARLRQEIGELESHFDRWDAENAATGRKLRSVARRIVLCARRVEVFVKEKTYPY